jgi:hypothetical protein
MSQSHEKIARVVAESLFAGERAIDNAVSSLSVLPGTITAARSEAGLPYGAAQGALSDATEALTLMVRARHHMARAHERLRETGEDMGLTEVAFGDIFECPPEGRSAAEAPTVRLVA